MRRYAETTTVSVEKSKAEIESTLIRYGASHFASGWDHECAKIGFQINDRRVRFILPLPNRSDERFTHYRHNSGKMVARAPDAIGKEWEQACRQRWRALALCIKAKLEACAAGITTFEDEFMAHIVLPNGSTVSEWMQPQLESAYTTGEMPKLLLEHLA